MCYDDHEPTCNYLMTTTDEHGNNVTRPVIVDHRKGAVYAIPTGWRWSEPPMEASSWVFIHYPDGEIFGTATCHRGSNGLIDYLEME